MQCKLRASAFDHKFHVVTHSLTGLAELGLQHEGRNYQTALLSPHYQRVFRAI